jgi:hypothetical protein
MRADSNGLYELDQLIAQSNQRLNMVTAQIDQITHHSYIAL